MVISALDENNSDEPKPEVEKPHDPMITNFMNWKVRISFAVSSIF